MPVPLAQTVGFQTAAASLPSAANIFTLALQRRWAKKDLAAQNLYNSPKEQLKRLREAGLPAAAFFSGGVSSQSDQPRSTEVAPDLGTSQIFDKFTYNQIQKKQMKILDAEIMEKEANARLKDSESKWWLSQFYNRYTGKSDKTALESRLQGEMNLLGYDVRARKVAADVAERFKGDITEQELMHSKVLNDILRQQFNDNQLMLSFKRDLARRLKQKNEGTTVLQVLEDLLGMWLMKSGSLNR